MHPEPFPEPSVVQARLAARNPGLDTSAMPVVALLKRAIGQLDRALEPVYEGAELTAPELDLLIPMRDLGRPVIARRLAEHRHMSRAGISKALAKLEKRGFVERAPSPADRRASLVWVTDAGKAALDALFPKQVAVESTLLAGLGEDRERVLEALSILDEVFERATRT
ncbi:MarR family transcriptional regulator [Amycolatopsis ultiminotia]|uniref:MarR family transcriptional regulator n=1 Tax=Amycolatopsis ultiminotia TaxID=543629 RepID=A0ABP6XEQ6_9PSEU